MLHVTLLRYAPVALFIAGCASAQQTYGVVIPATANIFAAGQSEEPA
jgi:P pilus assembly chaperone PapD